MLAACTLGGPRRNLGLAAQPSSWNRGLLALASLSVLAWVPVLLFTQPEQILRRRIEKEVQAGRVEEALRELSARRREDLPPIWIPPPGLGYRDFAEVSPRLLGILEVI